MIQPLLGVLAILLLILMAEGLWRRHVLKTEWSRKLVHMGVGSFVAFWPFFTTFRVVQLLSLAFCAVIIVSRYLHIFQGIHDVARQTWGELFYPVGIGLASVLTSNKYVFAAAVLHLSLADGVAAIIGLKFGKKHRYRIESVIKSYEGTLAFILTSAVILLWALPHIPGSGLVAWQILLIVPVTTAAVENVMPYGSDNLFIPLTVIALLRLAVSWPL